MKKPKLTNKVMRGIGFVKSIAETEGSVFYGQNAPDKKDAEYKEWRADQSDFERAIEYISQLQLWYEAKNQTK